MDGVVHYRGLLFRLARVSLRVHAEEDVKRVSRPASVERTGGSRPCAEASAVLTIEVATAGPCRPHHSYGYVSSITGVTGLRPVARGALLRVDRQ